MTKEVWTIQRLLDWSKQFFEDKGLDSPALDAQILLGHVLNMSRMQLILDAKRPLTDEELAQYKAVAIRRVKDRQPIAYILGQKEFWSLDLEVTPDVLIPRPDTECLVEHALKFIAAKREGRAVAQQTKKLVYEPIDERDAYYQTVEAVEKAREWAGDENLDDNEQSGLWKKEVEENINIENTDIDTENTDIRCHGENIECLSSDWVQKYRIVDVGTGSGAIALALRSELPSDCEVCAVDISPAALEVARRNADKNGLKVSFGISDLLQSCDGMFDMIVSNPPYITTAEMKDLAPEVKNEPRLALEAGADGLDIYRRLVPQAFGKLKPGGALLVEIGCSQGDAVSALFCDAGFVDVQVYKDYGRNPRVVMGIKGGE
jgi:release factor glutamine methyltransferase